jgi:hypothetical protein
MSIVRISRNFIILQRQLPSRLDAFRFKSDRPVGSKLEDEKLKADIDELAKKLDETLKKDPKKLETEIDKDFMSFKRLQEVNFILQL